MSSFAEVIVLVEGPTEQRFIKELLVPYLGEKGICLTPVVLDKPGEKGGDVKFARAKNDIERHLKQRHDTYLTLMVDYYGIRGDWPGLEESRLQHDPFQKAKIMNERTADEVKRLFPKQFPEKRLIPYVSMHEIEALYFSNPNALARILGVSQSLVDDILRECGCPEKINDNRATAPSKRLGMLSGRFKKTSTGIAIAREIGIDAMRKACPLFHGWVESMEKLTV
jgi:hypothetical protein